MEESKIPRVDALKIVNDESNKLMSWAFLIIGGSILAILHRDYLKLTGVYKGFYLVYILGWIALCVSVYWGERVTRSYLASVFVKSDLLEGISEKTNRRFRKQLSWFMVGVMIFAGWMIIYLLLWTFDFKTA